MSPAAGTLHGVDFAPSTSSSGASGRAATGRVLGVLPARLGSTRLPGKPLHPLLGRPMIQWVWERASGMSCLDQVVVATDSPQIVSVCEAFGARAVLTDPDHPSGTDRVAEVAAMDGFSDAGIVVNLQGDEPLMEEEPVLAAVEEVRSGRSVGTCATPVSDPADLRDPAVVKVVRRDDGSALYFSRAAIPYRRDGEMDDAFLQREPALRHLGVYAYRREALMRWVSLPPSRLELIEKLEQLRALEAGMTIGVAVVSEAEGGVDTPADARRIEQRMRELGLGS